MCKKDYTLKEDSQNCDEKRFTFVLVPVSFYAEMEDKEENMINDWLTDIIKKGLDK